MGGGGAAEPLTIFFFSTYICKYKYIYTLCATLQMARIFEETESVDAAALPAKGRLQSLLCGPSPRNGVYALTTRTCQATSIR